MSIINTPQPLKKLDYVLPEWTRAIWTSQAIKDKWTPRIQQINVALEHLEEASTVEGLRKVSYLFFNEQLFLEKSKYYATKGLILLPLMRANLSNGYSSQQQSVKPNAPTTHYRCVLGKVEDVTAFMDAWNHNNDSEMGRMLGYPECCIDFFQKTWVDAHGVDTSWQMFCNSDMSKIDHRSNILLRFAGVRWVNHLPCSFHCEPTHVIADRNRELLLKLGYVKEVEYLDQLLQMPIDWSAKHGIAEIKTPIMTISARTDATSDKYTFQYEGTFYDDDFPSGNKFPYINRQKNLVTLSKSFKRSLAAVDPATEWIDNGFTSLNSMNTEHAKLVTYITSVVIAPTSVIDFGCGNGLLLKKLSHQLTNTTMSGVEVDAERARRAQFAHPEFKIFNENIFGETSRWKDESYTVGIISENRLTESGKSVDFFLSRCKHLIVYSYDRDFRTIHHSA